MLATIINKKVTKTDNSFLAIFGALIDIVIFLLAVIVLDLAQVFTQFFDRNDVDFDCQTIGESTLAYLVTGTFATEAMVFVFLSRELSGYLAW